MQRVDVNELVPDDDGTRMLYDGDLFTGTSFETWPDGTPREEIEFDDGLRHGVVREWYANGQLKREARYRHGAAHGNHRGWYESGQLESDATYELSVLVSRRRYDESGRVVEDFRLAEDDRTSRRCG